MKGVWILVDVGCIECGMETSMLGVYTEWEAVKSAFDEAAKARDIKREWELGHSEPLEGNGSYCGGVSYFTGGQMSLEVHKAEQRG